LAESRTRSLSLRRFAALPKLCKVDYQPRSPQDKTADFKLKIPNQYCTVMIGQKYTFYCSMNNSNIDIRISILYGNEPLKKMKQLYNFRRRKIREKESRKRFRIVKSEAKNKWNTEAVFIEQVRSGFQRISWSQNCSVKGKRGQKNQAT
jgi:hypothetical protein